MSSNATVTPAPFFFSENAADDVDELQKRVLYTVLAYTYRVLASLMGVALISILFVVPVVVATVVAERYSAKVIGKRGEYGESKHFVRDLRLRAAEGKAKAAEEDEFGLENNQ